MLRRSHKKSRRGCLECKRRHVKCDEGRPICRLCLTSGRECSFTSHPSPDNPPASNGTQSTSPGDSNSQRVSVTPSPDPLPLDALNLNHMELVIHLITNKDISNLADHIDDYASHITRTLTRGLSAPYLLHQLLAFSARHLAFLHPDRSASYLHQAVTLQTRAISLFNVTRTHVNRSNCVAVLLFSTTLGHHLLADTLAKRDPGGLDPFMAHYVQCVGTNRGIYNVAMEAWPLLMESELSPILSWSAGFTSSQPRGNHCLWIRDLADGLGEKDREAFFTAINYLQLGFDAVLADEFDGNRYQMLFTWTMLAPPEFTALLAAKRPEVLVLMGHYALLLHYGRHMWQVGDSGRYILGLIVDYLDPEWHPWLEYPREMIGMCDR
ncbi:hypothetical protein ACJZ2D_012863 [Fusarium nematophilum]